MAPSPENPRVLLVSRVQARQPADLRSTLRATVSRSARGLPRNLDSSVRWLGPASSVRWQVGKWCQEPAWLGSRFRNLLCWTVVSGGLVSGVYLFG